MFFLRKYKPTSSGRRHRVVGLQFNFLKNQKFTFFLSKKYQNSGRNKLGLITVRHKGGGTNKQQFIFVDRIRLTYMLISVIVGIYKQKRNMCFFGLLRFSNGVYSYILLAHELKISWLLPESHFLVPVVDLPIGVLCFFLETNIKYIFFNICNRFSKKSLYARAAGSFCRFVYRNIDRNFLRILLPSKKPKNITQLYIATVGRASNIFAYKFRTGKSGINRALGIRPTVRGVAMNAVDHPNGGRTKTNKPEKNPWGNIAKYSK